MSAGAGEGVDWETAFAANRRRWDESVDIHMSPRTGFYRIEKFRAGDPVLGDIEAAEIGDVAGKRVLHLQCHFGLDSLSLARLGAEVTGLDFSPKAIAAARKLAEECDVPGRFVESNLYDAPSAIRGRFDIVFVTWGAICWLPDIRRWAEIVRHFLAPCGHLYLLEGHPAALMLEQVDGRLVPTYPYFQGAEPLAFDTDQTYTGDDTKFENTRTYEWIHTLSDILGALVGAGLRLDFLREHRRLAWQLFPMMVFDGSMWVMPDGGPDIPLAFSLKASAPTGTGGP